MSWLIQMTVPPAFAKALIVPSRISLPARSRPVVGSSSTSRAGSGISACASSTRCRSPPERLPSVLRSLPASPSCSSLSLDLLALGSRDAKKHRPALRRHGHEIEHRDRQAAVEVERLRHVADDFAFAPLDADAPRVRHLAEQRAHERRFAAAVRTDDAVDRAGRHLEGHVLQDRRVAERQVDALELDRRSQHVTSRSSPILGSPSRAS